MSEIQHHSHSCLTSVFSPTGGSGDEYDEDDSDIENDESDMGARDHVELDTRDNMAVISDEKQLDPPPLNSLVLDVLYRPMELSKICFWDQVSLYEKVRRRKGKRVTSVPMQNSESDSESGDGEEGDTLGENGELRECLMTSSDS